MKEVLDKLNQPVEPVSHEVGPDLYTREFVENIAAHPHTVELMTALTPGVEGLGYRDELTDDEKEKAAQMARDFVAENGHNTSAEVWRVMLLITDPSSRHERAETRLLRTYIDELIEARSLL